MKSPTIVDAQSQATTRFKIMGGSDIPAEALEGIVAGLSGCAMDKLDEGGGHPDKEGPCASCKGMTDFRNMRAKLDG